MLKLDYKETIDRHKKEINNIPIGFAIGANGLEKVMQELKVKNKDDLIGLGFAGAVIRKKDKDKYIKMIEKHEREKRQAIYNCPASAFYYQLVNHEYSYTRDITDAIIALGLSLSEIKENKYLKNGLDIAIKKIEKEKTI